MNGIDLPAPHGWLAWKGKKTALASLDDLPVGEKVVLVSNGEAYGEVILDDPAWLQPHEFDRAENAALHRVRPEERKAWWPDARRIAVYPMRDWEPYPAMRPATIEGGIVSFEDGEPSEADKALVAECKKLPKQIVLQPDVASVGENGIESEIEAIRGLRQIKAASGTVLPLYDLVLVRKPVLRPHFVENKTGVIESREVAYRDVPDWRGEGGDHAVQEEAEKETKVSTEPEEPSEKEGEMPMKPRAGESERDFIARCIPVEVDKGHKQQQAIAMCYSMWEEKQAEAEKAVAAPDPETGEGKGDFVLRCIPAVGQQGLDAERSKRICYARWDRYVIEHPEERDKEPDDYDISIRLPEDDDGKQPNGDNNPQPGGDGNGEEVRDGQNAAPEGTGEAVKAGKRIKKSILQRLQDAVDALKEAIGYGTYEDTEESSLLDLFKSQDYGFAVKTVKGEPWMFTWSTNAFEDRQEESFATDSLVQYVREAEKSDDRGTFDFWHIPDSDFADKKWQGVTGRFLVEAGPFKDTPIGKRAKAFFTSHPRAHPTIAPEGWGCSPQFRYLPEDRKGGTYHWIWVMKTSILPRAAAANVWTKGEVSMAKLSDEQRKAAAEIFGEDFVKSLEEEGERRTKELEEAGVAFKADKWAKAKAALKELADEAEGEALAKALKEMADELDDEQAVKSAKQLRATAKKMGGDMAGKLRQIAEMLAPDEEEPEEEKPKEPPEAKKEFDPTALIEQFSAAIKSKIDPVSQAINDLASRVEALEKGEAQKAALTPRRAQRATESEDTEVKEGDPLLAMKTRENERREGTLANAFFPKK